MSNKVDDFPDRLMKAAAHAGIPYSQAAIAGFLGEGLNRQTVDTWMNGSVPKADTLFWTADKFGVDPRWFATGTGEMLPRPVSSELKPDEEDLLSRYQHADDRWKAALVMLSRVATEQPLAAARREPLRRVRNGEVAEVYRKTKKRVT